MHGIIDLSTCFTYQLTFLGADPVLPATYYVAPAIDKIKNRCLINRLISVIVISINIILK